jgi:hypothetical protein
MITGSKQNIMRETENKALTIFKEIEKRNINDTVKPKFELCLEDVLKDDWEVVE